MAYLIANANVVDGTGREPFRGAVRVEAQRIAAVIQGLDTPDAAGATVIDGRGATLMPGLIESHAHLGLADMSLQDLNRLPIHEQMLITVRNARTMLDCAYTSAFSAASAKPRLDIVLRREIEAGREAGPRLLANGPEKERRNQMARWDTIQVDGQPMRVYLGAPGGGGAAPGVVVIMHGPGLERFMEDRVEELARQGYAAVCPDLYHRQPQDDGADMMTRIGRLRDTEIIADADAAVALLRRLPDTRVGDLAVLGFCMGGRITYMLAGARPTAWKAAGVFYGGNIMKAWGEGPAPFNLTKNIACPVIGFFGLEDTNPSPADVDKIDAELARHGKAHEFHRYAGAGHAFLNFTNPERYRPEQAKDAWSKMLGFLSRYLKGGPA